MPKFKLNEKAVEGRARKAATAEAKELKKKAEKEAKINEEWKIGTKDESKKQEEEAKRLEKLAKKKERERLEAEELAKIPLKIKPSKIDMSSLSPCPSIHSSSSYKPPLEPLNRSNPVISTEKGFTSKDILPEYSASNLDDAISLLEAATVSSENISLERHPERRVKAAFAAYEEKEMPILKLENPTLRLSQLREILKKNWRKAPENPFNQTSISYCTAKNEEKEISSQIFEDTLNNFKK